MPRKARDQSATGIYHVMIRGINRHSYSSWGNDYLDLGDLHVCMTESVIRRYTLAELTTWVDMPMPERYGCIDIDERRVIPDIEIREAVINACGLRSISDFQLLTLERRKKCYSRGYAFARCQAKTTLQSYWNELRDHQEYSKKIDMKTGTHTQVPVPMTT